MQVNPVLVGLGAAVQGPSQYFTLDAACFYGCQETGAGNCTEICQVPAPSPSPTQTSVVQQAVAKQAISGQLIPGFSNYWLLGSAVALVVIMAAR